MKSICIFIAMASSTILSSQELPFRELETDTSMSLTEGIVLSRFIEGMGFRFYWATEGLRPEDLSYRPSEEARSTEETIRHIYDLTIRIAAAAEQKPLSNYTNNKELEINEVRSQALLLLERATDIFSKSEDLGQFSIQSRSGEISLLYLMNGPINDATWHCGQIASFRRTSGNPINSNVNHFYGIVNE